MITNKIKCILVISLFLMFCDNPDDPTEKFESYIFIDGVLVANCPFEGLRIQKTVDLETQTYNYYDDFSDLPIEQRVTGSKVQINSNDTTIVLLESADCPGLYISDPLSPFFPKPNTCYDLEIVIDSVTEIGATTIVPGQLEILNPDVLVDTATFGVGDYSIQLKSTNAAGYFVGVSKEASDSSDDVIFYIDQSIPNNTWLITVDDCPLIPWNFFRYLYKKTNVKVYAVDLNFYDFHALGPESDFDPIPPIYHLQGDNVIGYFGAISIDSFYVYLKPGKDTEYSCMTIAGYPCDCPDNN
jgi:hypothetical protein